MPAKLTKEAVLKQLKKVEDPEIRQSIVDIGLVYNVKIDKGMVVIDLTFTSPACPMAPFMIGEIDKQVKKLAGVKGVTVNIVWEPMWTPERMSKEARAALGL